MNCCVNCNIATNRCNAIGRRVLDDESILLVISQWCAPLPVTNQNYVCQACWSKASDVINERQPLGTKQLGHSSVCVRCGRSLLGQRQTHLLRTDSTREYAICNVIREWIIPRILDEADRICHSCWITADKAAIKMKTGPSTSSSSQYFGNVSSDEQVDVPTVQPEEQQNERSYVPAETMRTALPGQQQNEPSYVPSEALGTTPHEPTILLPGYTRAVETESRCFIYGCQRMDRYRVPQATRKMLLFEYKYYVPKNNRLCDVHLVIEAWDFLDSIRSNYLELFTARHIIDMMELKDPEKENIFNFLNIALMEDHFVHTWIGLPKAQFHQMFQEVPQLLDIPNSSQVLAAYLMKLRTGESNDRLASLFKISRRTFEKWISQARKSLSEHFVPQHIGLNHISRTEIIQRNLAVPTALWEGESRPIAIFDGTYCYIEKSSNYFYQKKTYSLHKYRNLTKPFLLVCTDGHIIDIMGPYPATTTDAEIMNYEFSENYPLRDFFQDGDVFILDRGFRDSISFLNECGYRTFVPASLEAGETQLSTLEANKSRTVTICRWVVEVVNGRFKRDFKLFRQCYFNTASKTLWEDFKVAAAIINRFHPPITDRIDAREIINEINVHMHEENRLGDFIVNNNINRRRADFESITVQNDDLNDFPQMSYNELILISLGTYQLKQSRSYYGEHIRGNDGFVIEVCREVDNDLLRELSAPSTCWLLRGRIQSRHISRKTYFVYILVDSNRRGRDAILGQYCNCIVGRRTVGCCAHIMSTIWYLSWARYRDNILPPAQFLDDILLIVEE